MNLLAFSHKNQQYTPVKSIFCQFYHNIRFRHIVATLFVSHLFLIPRTLAFVKYDNVAVKIMCAISNVLVLHFMQILHKDIASKCVCQNLHQWSITRKIYGIYSMIVFANVINELQTEERLSSSWHTCYKSKNMFFLFLRIFGSFFKQSNRLWNTGTIDSANIRKLLLFHNHARCLNNGRQRLVFGFNSLIDIAKGGISNHRFIKCFI